MPIRQDDNQPNRRFGIINLVLIGFGVLLLASSFIPSNGMQQVPRVPYSLFMIKSMMVPSNGLSLPKIKSVTS